LLQTTRKKKGTVHREKQHITFDFLNRLILKADYYEIYEIIENKNEPNEEKVNMKYKIKSHN
jgi:hypothetical protein